MARPANINSMPPKGKRDPASIKVPKNSQGINPKSQKAVTEPVDNTKQLNVLAGKGSWSTAMGFTKSRKGK